MFKRKVLNIYLGENIEYLGVWFIRFVDSVFDLEKFILYVFLGWICCFSCRRLMLDFFLCKNDFKLNLGNLWVKMGNGIGCLFL